METAFFLKKIKEDFSRRQASNPSFSLRAYARLLKMPPSTLSQVLLGNRSLPLKNSNRVLECVKLNARERTLFIDSIGKRVSLDRIRLNPVDQRLILDETYYQIISEWDHYAVLMLFDCVDFDSSPSWLSERLGISLLRVEVVVENLVSSGLVKRGERGRLVRTHARFRTTEDVTSQALQSSHRASLEMARKKLEEVETDLRDFSTMMLALDLAKLPEAKLIIREFRQKMAELLKNGKKKQVYELAIQLYPVTCLKGKGKI